MKEDEARSVIIAYCRRLYDKGFVPGVDGNVSLRVDGGRALVTPTGVCKGAVTEEQLSLLSLEGKHISGDRPSSETPMHLAAYRRRADVNACIHAHSPNIGAFALAGEPVDTRYAPFAYIHLGIIGEVGYITPGTAEFHEAVEAAAGGGARALILFGHGSLVLGRDMREAFERLDLFEAYAGMLLRAQLLGGAKPLSDAELLRVKGG
jgi:L-fuculose-phosphate aldolase